MSLQANVFDEAQAKRELKKCPPIVRKYVELLLAHQNRQSELLAKALGKLKELSTKKD